MRVGSLFAGIGGFDLGFERAGFSVAWHAEIDRTAAAILLGLLCAVALCGVTGWR